MCSSDLSERGGRAGWSVSNDQGKVGAAAGLQSGLAGSKAEAAWEDEMGKFAHGVDPFNLADVAPVSRPAVVRASTPARGPMPA